MKVLYFAWVRERIGKAEETVEPPADVRTVGDLIGWLAKRGESYAHAFETPRVIRAAIHHAHVKPDAALAGPREIALFPPRTGGCPSVRAPVGTARQSGNPFPLATN